MNNPDFVRGRCPSCDAERADLKARHKTEYHDYVYDAWNDYMILECRGCGNIYFKVIRTNSEDIKQWYNDHTGEPESELVETAEIWPLPMSRTLPEWIHDLGDIDQTLQGLLRDVYTALSSDLGVLAAIGMRTVFDRASELLGIDANKSFAKKLKALKDGDHITEKERVILEIMVDAGSAAAHRGWKPSKKDLEAMIIILESFLHRVFLVGELGTKLKKKVPARGT